MREIEEEKERRMGKKCFSSSNPWGMFLALPRQVLIKMSSSLICITLCPSLSSPSVLISCIQIMICHFSSCPLPHWLDNRLSLSSSSLFSLVQYKFHLYTIVRNSWEMQKNCENFQVVAYKYWSVLHRIFFRCEGVFFFTSFMPSLLEWKTWALCSLLNSYLILVIGCDKRLELIRVDT